MLYCAKIQNDYKSDVARRLATMPRGIRMSRFFVIVAGVIMSISQQCNAQTLDNLLRGLTEIKLDICGL